MTLRKNSFILCFLILAIIAFIVIFQANSQIKYKEDAIALTEFSKKCEEISNTPMSDIKDVKELTDKLTQEYNNLKVSTKKAKEVAKTFKTTIDSTREFYNLYETYQNDQATLIKKAEELEKKMKEQEVEHIKIAKKFISACEKAKLEKKIIFELTDALL